jgi:predicted  nucleic acid-binding Zn-ribbon protein
MMEELSLLLEIQVRDTEVDRLRRRAAAVPKDIEKASADVATGEAEVAARKKELEDAKKRRRDSEREVERLDAEIQKLLAQQNLLKSNKDFTAMTREIEALKEKRSDLETQVILILDAEEEIGSRIGGAQRELDTTREKASAERKRLEGVLAGVESELSRALQARAEVAERLPSGLRARYERIREGKQGAAVVPVVKGACGGCFRALPPQRVNDVKLGSKVVACEGCGRLLVWSGDGEEAA